MYKTIKHKKQIQRNNFGDKFISTKQKSCSKGSSVYLSLTRLLFAPVMMVEGDF